MIFVSLIAESFFPLTQNTCSSLLSVKFDNEIFCDQRLATIRSQFMSVVQKRFPTFLLRLDKTIFFVIEGFVLLKLKIFFLWFACDPEQHSNKEKCKSTKFYFFRY